MQMAIIRRRRLDPVEDAMCDAARRLCAGSDVLIGHYFIHPLQTAAEAAGRPSASVLLSHAAPPSDFDHPLTVPGAGKRLHRMLWWLTRTLLNRTLKHYPDRSRSQLGLPPVRDVVTQVWLSNHLTLAAVSPRSAGRSRTGPCPSAAAASSIPRTWRWKETSHPAWPVSSPPATRPSR